MSKEEFKQIFFELLTEDEDFKQRLTEFIINAVAEKFVEKVAQVDESPKLEEVAPVIEQKNPSDELQTELEKLSAEKISVEKKRDELQADFDKLSAEKISVEKKRDELQADFDKLSAEKISVEKKRDELQTELEKLSAEKFSVEKKRDELQADFDKLSAEKISVEKKRDELQADFDKLSVEKFSVEKKRDELQADFDKLNAEKFSVEKKRDELQADFDKLSAEKFSVEKKRDELQADFDKLSAEKESIKGERDSLKLQLVERFADGWEIYQKFLSIDESARKNSGLYTKNFEAFICSGAQMKRLESIWESAIESKRAGRINDAEIFWNVFAYCVRLVNAAQGDNIIEILNTQIGERYETDKHSTSGTSSSTQGVVREVILNGYRNNISRKIVKKSNVRVG